MVKEPVIKPIDDIVPISSESPALCVVELKVPDQEPVIVGGVVGCVPHPARMSVVKIVRNVLTLRMNVTSTPAY